MDLLDRGMVNPSKSVRSEGLKMHYLGDEGLKARSEKKIGIKNALSGRRGLKSALEKENRKSRKCTI